MRSKINAPKAPVPRTVTTRCNTAESRLEQVRDLAESLPADWQLELKWYQRVKPMPLMEAGQPMPPMTAQRLAMGALIISYKPKGETWLLRYKVTSRRGVLVSLCSRKRGPQKVPLAYHAYRAITEDEFTKLPAAAKRILNRILQLLKMPMMTA